MADSETGHAPTQEEPEPREEQDKEDKPNDCEEDPDTTQPDTTQQDTSTDIPESDADVDDLPVLLPQDSQDSQEPSEPLGLIREQPQSPEIKSVLVEDNLLNFLAECNLLHLESSFAEGGWTLDLIWDTVLGDGDPKVFFDSVHLEEKEKQRLMEGLASYAPYESGDEMPPLEEKPAYCACGEIVQGQNMQGLWECLRCHKVYVDKKQMSNVLSLQKPRKKSEQIDLSAADKAVGSSPKAPVGSSPEEPLGSGPSPREDSDEGPQPEEVEKEQTIETELQGLEEPDDTLSPSSTDFKDESFFPIETREASPSVMSMTGWQEVAPTTFLDAKQSLLNMSFAVQEHLLRMHDQIFNMRPDLEGRTPGGPTPAELLDEYKAKQRNLEKQLEDQRLQLDFTNEKQQILQEELQSERDGRKQFELRSVEHRKQLQARFTDEIKRLEEELAGEGPQELQTLEEEADRISQRESDLKTKEKSIREREITLESKLEDHAVITENERKELIKLRQQLESREEQLKRKEELLEKQEKDLNQRVYEQKKGSTKIQNQQKVMEFQNQQNIKRGAKISKWLDRLNKRVYEKCAFCHENVMPGSERLNVHKKIVHWNCFRCQNPDCRVKLKPHSYRVMKQLYFCDACAKDGRVVRATIKNPTVKILGRDDPEGIDEIEKT